MKRLPTLLGLVLAASIARAAPPSNAAPAVQQFTLANGMSLIVRPDHRAPTAVHMLWVRVGAMDEVDGTSGVAHALEHMMFKGSATLKPGEFSERVAALGGQQNAFTNRDATAYHEQVPADRLEAVMALNADRFASNQWPDIEFTREIEVVKEERRQRTEESPRARLFEAFNAMVWQASPYRRPIIGWMSDIDAMTPQDVRDFHQRWYVPANAAVVVAGDVDPQRVREIAERTYGRIPARAVPARKPRTEPAQQGPRRLEYRAVADQALVVLAWHAPRYSGKDDAASRDALALAVLSGVLDGYSGARLERALVQGQGTGGQRIADSASSGYGLMGRGPQVFTASAVPARGVTPEATMAALKAEIQRIAREGVSEEELQRVKTQWTASEVYKLDSVFSQAQEQGSYWVNGLPTDAGERLMAGLRAVTAEQVRAVAGRYFTDRTLNTGVLVPEARAAEGRP
ncbi:MULTISPECIES: pitrilysin family protein [unclassified Hydrogenophaga]|uniref:M16 family metallopeptidase n=1 Tax=unclassified Hydrogenophaga TaxID=2610897 RepID=UPI00087894C5|nr:MULTISPECIES: pitrilysin family protein [unclassified Hydrogenophaga]MBN9369630.1 insulinase family protein [Hydrogenophaga sp.]OJV68575.1 MAG: peptidase M16 [Hydrogenophaga sp. 70-12]